jgi:hypothetical protein
MSSFTNGFDRVNQNQVVHQFKTLLMKRGIGIGSLLNGSSNDFNVLLAAASLSLRGTQQDEFQVNLSLKQWLEGPGQFVQTDHVEIRRWLVDMGLWVRDGFGREYSIAHPVPERFSVAVAAIAGIEQSAFAEAARREHHEKRAARKAAWLAQATQA